MSRSAALPILDLSKLDASPADRAVFLDELRAAAHQFGGFYITGHGVDQKLIDQNFALSRRFFDLPENDKLEIEMAKSPHFRGYTRIGFEHTRGQVDWREQIDVGAERPAIEQTAATPVWTRLQGPNQWPSALPELRDPLLQLQGELARVATQLVRALAVTLDQPQDVLDPLIADAPNKLIKIIRYPGRGAGGEQGCGPHKDSGLITLVVQHERSGLEIESPDGWIKAEPIPGTFVVNISELLELASNGYYRANVHQVVSPPEGADRLSIAFFLGARLDSRIPVLDLPAELAAAARGPEQDPNNPLYRQVGENYLKGRLRSHPDVAQRHYADLL